MKALRTGQTMSEINVTPPPPPMPEQQGVSSPSPTPVASQPLPVMSYATHTPANQAAVVSLVFGLLFFIPLAAPGIVAILLGRRGLRAAAERPVGRAGLARAGIVLGVVNLVLSLLFAAWLPFALVRARQQAQTVACATNLRSLAQATMIYSAGNRGFLPPTIDHLAAVLPRGMPAQVFTCPACAGNPAKPPVTVGTTVSSSYHFLTPAARLSQIKQPATVVLAYEPPANHDNRGMNVVFCDGHVEFITGPTAQIAAELAAGQNPPPSHK